MLYTELNVNNETYKLRLTTRSIESIYNKIYRNPVELILDLQDNKIPKMSELVLILHESLQKYHHNIKLDDVYDILDSYMDEGKTIFDFISNEYVELLKVSGLIPDKDDEEETEDTKN